MYDDQKGLYYVCFNYGTNADGRRDRRADLAEAELALEQFQQGRGGRLLCDSSRLTLGEWLEYWLEEVIAPNRAYTTYYCYRSVIKNYIVPALGCIHLRQLEPWHIQKYYAEKMREGRLDSNSVHKHHILLHTALQLAFRQKILRENPVEGVEAPREHPTRQFYYTPEQLRDLFREVEDSWLELVVKLGAYLGLRRGEICGLRHTFASLANSARIPLVDIGKALGHKDVSITGRIYTHIFDQTHQEVFNTVSARIKAG